MTRECEHYSLIELSEENDKLRIENATLKAEIKYLRRNDYHKTFTPVFKENVRDFQGRKCVLCGKKEEEQKEKLTVHHVEYDKYGDCYESLFVILCNKCHRKPHPQNSTRERPYWINLFTDIINERFGGKCCYSKQEYRKIRMVGWKGDIILHKDPVLVEVIKKYIGFRPSRKSWNSGSVISLYINRDDKHHYPRNRITSCLKYMVELGMLETKFDEKRKKQMYRSILPTESGV